MTVTVSARDPSKMLNPYQQRQRLPVYHLRRAWNLECWSPKHFPNCLVISAQNFKWPSLILAAILDFQAKNYLWVKTTSHILCNGYNFTKPYKYIFNTIHKQLITLIMHITNRFDFQNKKQQILYLELFTMYFIQNRYHSTIHKVTSTK